MQLIMKIFNFVNFKFKRATLEIYQFKTFVRIVSLREKRKKSAI